MKSEDYLSKISNSHHVYKCRKGYNGSPVWIHYRKRIFFEYNRKYNRCIRPVHYVLVRIRGLYVCVWEVQEWGKYIVRLGVRRRWADIIGAEGREGSDITGRGDIAGGGPGPVVEGDRVRHYSFSSTHYKIQFSPSYSLRIYTYSSLFLPLQSHTYHIIRVLSFRSPISFYSSYSLVFSRCNLISLLFAFSLFLLLYFSPSLSFFFDFIKWVLLR